jgi:hypothetical protein
VEVTQVEGENGSLTHVEVDRVRWRAPVTTDGASSGLPEGQVVRRRLAALDHMVSNRLEAFASKHEAQNPGLSEETNELAHEFHATLNAAYDAFLESGDRHELMHAVRDAFSQARAGFRFMASTLGEPSGEPEIIVDPGPGATEGGAEVVEVDEEPTGGSTTVPGAPGSGVTVAVTPLPEAPPTEGTSSETSSLAQILADLVAHFSEVLSEVEDLLGQNLDESSLQFAIDLEIKLELGGTSLGELLDTLG